MNLLEIVGLFSLIVFVPTGAFLCVLLAVDKYANKCIDMREFIEFLQWRSRKQSKVKPAK